MPSSPSRCSSTNSSPGPTSPTGRSSSICVAIGVLFVFLLPRLSAGRMAIVAAVFIAHRPRSCRGSPSREYDLLFDPVYPPVTLAAIYVSGTALAFMRTERERAAIRGAFGLYLSPDLVEQLARHPDLLQLGGELREITVMFTDVRGFTRISEQFDPHGLTAVHEPLPDADDRPDPAATSGTIDKYMGDAIMAFWNAPLDVDRHAALRLRYGARHAGAPDRAERGMEGRGRGGGPPAHSGEYRHRPQHRPGLGRQFRLACSASPIRCLGDDVNLASRLEGQCKTYSVGIIIGDKTRLQVPDYAALELDLVMVKGKTEPESASMRWSAALPWRRRRPITSCVRQQAAFLAQYRIGGFAEALEMIDGCEAAAAARRLAAGLLRA